MTPDQFAIAVMKSDAARIANLYARVEALELALKPFALLRLNREAEAAFNKYDEESAVYIRIPGRKPGIYGECKINVGDIRRARAALGGENE